MELILINRKDFAKIYEQMQNAFIIDEIRDFDKALATLDEPCYKLYHLCAEGNNVGFVAIWELEGFAFIEHLVVYPEYRNKGYGQCALSALKELYDSPLVLEAEPPTCEMAKRRIGFYERNGFICNGYDYLQPSYREGGNTVSLLLLSYPSALLSPSAVAKELYTKVYKTPFTRSDIVVRSLCQGDDLDKVAELIYYTDKYIFPYLYKADLRLAKDIIGQMICTDTVYNYKNITAAVCEGEIAGILVCLDYPISVNYKSMASCFANASQEIKDRFSRVFREYYKLFEEELQGVYIANVCVDSAFRCKGVAKKLLQESLKANTTYHLETVKDNAPALKLYKSLGFEIEYEYGGFDNVPCYKMKRERN